MSANRRGGGFPLNPSIPAVFTFRLLLPHTLRHPYLPSPPTASLQVARLLDSMDADGNSCVDSMEFIAASMRGLVRHVAEGDDQRRLRDAFERFDRQDRGFVTREDLKVATMRMGLCHMSMPAA